MVLVERSQCLSFPVDELQVDGGSRAEQAVGFGLDIISERRYADVELLNELRSKTTERSVRLLDSCLVQVQHLN